MKYWKYLYFIYMYLYLKVIIITERATTVFLKQIALVLEALNFEEAVDQEEDEQNDQTDHPVDAEHHPSPWNGQNKRSS